MSARRGRDPLAVGLAWIAPWLAGFIVFTAGPIAFALGQSLTDDPLLEPPVFVGFAQYTALLGDPVFGRALLNTALYTAAVVPLSTALAFLLAAGVHRMRRAGGLCLTAILLPSLVPAVAAAIIWTWMLSPELGLVNRVLDPALALVGARGPNWLGDRRWAMVGLVLASLWTIGPAVVIFVAALRGVPRQLEHAAALDGAGSVGRLVHVTLPAVAPVVRFNAIVALIGAWQVFTLPWIMTGGGPDRATYFHSMIIYDTAFQYGRMGAASAMAWVQLAIMLAATALLLRNRRRRGAGGRA